MHTSGDMDLQVNVFTMSPKVCHPYGTFVVLCVPPT